MKIKIFTLVNGQEEFKKIWLEYYSRFNCDLLMLEHITEGHDSCSIESYKGIEYEHRKIFFPELFNHNFLTNLVNSTQNNLIEHYNVVIYTDIDEIIIPKNYDNDLRAYCKDIKKQLGVIKCSGYHTLGETYWSHDVKFDKPLITKIPVRWTNGYHKLAKKPRKKKETRDKNLVLVHIHRLNYNIAKKHWEERRKYNIDKEAYKKELSYFNYTDDREKWDNWYQTKNHDNKIEIPKWIQKIISPMSKELKQYDV